MKENAILIIRIVKLAKREQSL